MMEVNNNYPASDLGVEGNWRPNHSIDLDVEGNQRLCHTNDHDLDVEGNRPDLAKDLDVEGNWSPDHTNDLDVEGNHPELANDLDVEGNWHLGHTNDLDVEENHPEHVNDLDVEENLRSEHTNNLDVEGNPNPDYTNYDVEGNCLGRTTLTLIVGGEKMTCSRDKLSSTSDYFKAMFDSNMKESTSDCISLEQVDPEAMRIILDFLVTGRLDLTQENVHIVTEAACRFQMKLVVKQCCELMEDLLNDDSCLAIMSLTHTFALEELFIKAKRHCLWYFTEVIQTSNFVDIDIHLLCQILSERKLVVKSEMKVFDAIERWISHDITERKKHLEELLPLIRKEALTEEEISSLKQKTLVNNYQHMFENFDTASAAMQKYRQVPYCLWSLGGQDDPFDDIYASDDEPDVEPQPKILKLSDIDTTCRFEGIPMDEQDHPSIIQQETGYSVCVHGKDIYVSGGLTSLGPGRNRWLLDVWKLDTFTMEWGSVTQLQSPRRHHTMVSVGESLVLLGGFGKFRMKLKTCEEFNIKTGEWKELPPMPEESFLIAACATSSKRIYAFKSQAFYYDLGSMHWTKVPTCVYSVTKLVPSSAVYIHSTDCVYIVSRYHKDVLCFNLTTQTLTTVGQFQYGEAASDAVEHKGRVCRFNTKYNLEWYDYVKKEFRQSRFVDGILVLNFHLLPIPDMLDV